jgi:hypothetical protein
VISIDRHEVGSRFSFGTADIEKANAKRRQPAEVAEAPAPPRHAAHGARVGELRQKGGDQVFARAEKVVGHDDQDERERDRARLREIKQCGKEHAAERGGEQQRLLRRVRVGPGADQRTGKKDCGV